MKFRDVVLLSNSSTAMLMALAASALTLPVSPANADPLAARFNAFSYAGVDVDPGILKLPGEYRNPILQGFYPDPSLIRVGTDYYLNNSSFGYFPGLPIWHSKDLVHWNQIANAMDRASQFSFGGANTVETLAPDLSFHDGTWRIVDTAATATGSYGIFLMTSADPKGPWSDQIVIKGALGYDPSLFYDDDGKTYLISTSVSSALPAYTGHYAIYGQQIDLATNTLIGTAKVLVDAGFQPELRPTYCEGPHLFKRHGYYYLNFAQDGTEINHTEVVFRSDAVFGTYESSPTNPILTQKNLDPNRPFPITSTGHAEFVNTQNGQWWAAFLGTRPYQGDDYNTGRETFLLPASWQNDWPSILPSGEAVPYTVEKPNLPEGPPPSHPTAGSYTLIDRFDTAKLPPYWMTMYPPTERWYSTGHGVLSITARNQSIGDTSAQPSLIALRQQHLYASAATSMSFTPNTSGDRAGLVAYQDQDYYYFFGLTKVGSETAVVLMRRSGATDPTDGTVIDQAVLPATAASGPVSLRIDAVGATYNFSYAAGNGNWKSLATGVDGTILSSAVSGGFTGVTIGMYAYSGSTP